MNDTLMTMLEGVAGAKRLLDKTLPKMNVAQSALDAEAIAAWNEGALAIEKAARLLPGLEWSGTAHGQGSGPHGSGGDGYPYPACPECGGLEKPNGEFIAEAVGHRSGCRLAALLGSPTVLLEGETGRLAL